ncbi:MAG: hypothetical protein IPJ77_07370 [Planctomycetes bacterium]|nr:hypothetical protein [Planctomycetota bacterium]
MRTIQIHPLSLAVGAIAVTAAFVLTAQTTAPAQTTWLPPKAMIVNVFEEPTVAISVPAGGTYTVLTVPSDRWLTITGASARTTAPSIMRWSEAPSGGAPIDKGVVISGWPVNPAAGGPTTMWGAPEATPVACGGPLGWTFAPGSSIVIHNAGTGLAYDVLGYSLIGYYSRN